MVTTLRLVAVRQANPGNRLHWDNGHAPSSCPLVGSQWGQSQPSQCVVLGVTCLSTQHGDLVPSGHRIRWDGFSRVLTAL